MDVPHGPDCFLVYLDGQLFLPNVVRLSISFDFLASTIAGVVIDQDDTKVGVVLLQHTPDILDVTVILHVVVARDHYTHRQLRVL